MVDCGRSGALVKRVRVSALCALLVLGGVSLFRHDSSSPSRPVNPGPATNASLMARLPLAFEPNMGQSAGEVKFLARGRGYGLFLTPTDAMLTLSAARGKSAPSVRMQFSGASAAPAISGINKLPGHTNYFIGNDPSRWLRDVSQFARVRYENLYRGVDLDFYGREGRLEYDFTVAPGADPKQIELQFQGADAMTVAQTGDLVLNTAGGELRFQAPRVYQKSGDREDAVEGRFVLLAGGRAGFQIGAYDRGRALVIDPVLALSSYLGGSGDESCAVITGAAQGFVPHCPAIALDSASRVYIAGSTNSAGNTFPGGSGPALNGTADVFVARISSTGSALVLDYLTYLGGASGAQYPVGIGVDSGFNVLVAGNTSSSQFPTVNGLPGSPSGNHAFVSKFDSGANLIYSTYLAGSGTESASDLALDRLGRAYVIGTTTSSDFPVTPGALQGQYPAGVTNQFFFAKLDSTQTGSSSLLYATYFGGAAPSAGSMVGGAVAVDSNLNVYLAGGTTFTDIPVVNAYQASLKGGIDVWAAELKAPATNTQQYSRLYETYFGGSGDDVAYGVATDGTSMYFTGSTTSADVVIPAGSTPFQKCLDDPSNPTTCTTGATASDAFVAKFGIPTSIGTAQGSVPLNYFSYLGGSGTEVGLAITADSVQNARIAGFTKSGNFLNTDPLLNASGGNLPLGGTDAFFARIVTVSGSRSATSLLGGSGTDIGTSLATDVTLKSYIGGETTSGDFPAASQGQPPITPLQPSLSGNSDAFISQLGSTISGLALTCPVGVTVNGNPVTSCSPVGASVNPSPAGVGSVVTFTFPIYNTGDPVNGGLFTATLQGSNGTITNTSGCIVNSTTAVCSLGIINTSSAVTDTTNSTTVLSQSASVTFSVTPTAPNPPLTSASSIGVNGVLNVAGTTFQRTLGPQGIVNDFTVQASPASQTVTAGNQATYTVTVTPTGPIPASVSLGSCSGLPAGAACSFSGNPIPNLNNLAQSRVLKITTAPRVTTPASLFHKGSVFYAFWLPVSGLAFVGAGVTRKRRWLAATFVVCMLAFTILQAGCGSSSSNSQTTTGTPAGTYTVTMDATSGSAKRSTSVILTVQ